ncbi:MAG TPA: hypothetical protein VIY28_06955 [Pseudonocardiaceae bacterium]
MDFVWNILASLLFAILGAVSYRFVYRPVKRRLNVLTRCLPFAIDDSTLLVCYGLIPPGASGSSYYAVQEGDLAGITLAQEVLAANYGSERLALRGCVAAEGLIRDADAVFTISGPRWNRITSACLGKLGSPIWFEVVDGRVELVVQPAGRSPQRYRTARNPAGEARVSYGIVLVGTHLTVDQRAQRVVTCAGVNNVATYGSLCFLLGLRNRRSFRGMRELKAAAMSGRFVALLRVENTAPTLDDPVRMPLDASHITVEVVQILAGDDFYPPYVYRYPNCGPDLAASGASA